MRFHCFYVILYPVLLDLLCISEMFVGTVASTVTMLNNFFNNTSFT